MKTDATVILSPEERAEARAAYPNLPEHGALIAYANNKARRQQIDPLRYTKSLRARRLRGAAALMEMLEHIGVGSDDHAVAAVMTDSELELREMLSFTLEELIRNE